LYEQKSNYMSSGILATESWWEALQLLPATFRRDNQEHLVVKDKTPDGRASPWNVMWKHWMEKYHMPWTCFQCFDWTTRRASSLQKAGWWFVGALHISTLQLSPPPTSSIAPVKSRMETFWYQLTNWLSWKWPLNKFRHCHPVWASCRRYLHNFISLGTISSCQKWMTNRIKLESSYYNFKLCKKIRKCEEKNIYERNALCV